MSDTKQEKITYNLFDWQNDIISKMVNTDFPIHKIIAKGCSARAFSTKPVEALKLLSTLEAARWISQIRDFDTSTIYKI